MKTIEIGEATFDIRSGLRLSNCGGSQHERSSQKHEG